MVAAPMTNTNTLGFRSMLILLLALEEAVTTLPEGGAVATLREGPRTREMLTLLAAKRRLNPRYTKPTDQGYAKHSPLDRQEGPEYAHVVEFAHPEKFLH